MSRRIRCNHQDSDILLEILIPNKQKDKSEKKKKKKHNQQYLISGLSSKLKVTKNLSRLQIQVPLHLPGKETRPYNIFRTCKRQWQLIFFSLIFIDE